MTPEEKQKLKTQKEKEKEKRKLLSSSKFICKSCGFIGKPKKKKKGSWIFFFIKLAIVSPIVALIILLSIAEGVLRMLSFSAPQSVIWNIGFEKFFPHAPYKLYGCGDCGEGNSMHKLKTREGRYIFERFDRDKFIMRR